MTNFEYLDERFGDIRILRFRLKGFEYLSLRQKKLIYFLSQATLYGRDITFDQYGEYNLDIRKMLESVYIISVNDDSENGKALVEYLKRVWFSNGIYHHYGCDKFIPGFSQDYLRDILLCGKVDKRNLPLKGDETVEKMIDRLFPVIFDPKFKPKRVNKEDGVDIVLTSACNFYHNVSQLEVEQFYQQQKDQHTGDEAPISYGLNTTLAKINGVITEIPWKENGLYGEAICKIVYWLEKALSVVENDGQKSYIEKLIRFYKSGDLRHFNEYCIEWVRENESKVDFINGFIEVYGDPLGMKGTWEGIVEYVDEEATLRTRVISENAQWFEDNSPVENRFKKKHVKGVTAKAICAAMLGGEEYPSTAIGINLPNADWIREQHGSKSISISNVTEAYDQSSLGNGFYDEFIYDDETRDFVRKYGPLCDALHTDLHECLGHGSGQLIPGVSPDALKAYGNTIEEARADLFGLYYIADRKLVELGLLPNDEAFKSLYYKYILNGLMTQLVRIKPGQYIEEAHMRNRALIARWCLENGRHKRVIEIVEKGGKSFVRINDYHALRALFAQLLHEIQRIKSEGDYESARNLVESYAVTIDDNLHHEILDRYQKLNIAPYHGFVNPILIPQYDGMGEIKDVLVDYSESYSAQMLRYSRNYATLI